MKKIILLLFCFVGLWGSVGAQNPVIKDIGMSDPHIRVFHDSLYLFCGHDSSPDDKTWIMKDWRVFSSSDLCNWKQVQTISPKDNYMDDSSTDCWAADAATRNGMYYFYFSDRKRGIGVMRANSPLGKFTDALGKSLVSPMHDPTLLIDDDENKTPYLVYGDKEGGGFHIARLNDDMISVAEESKPIIINGKEWENAPFWMDKNYIFKRNGKYYLSWGRDYAISENIYGPYESVGAVGTGHHLDEYAHGSFFEWKGQFYHIWCYYIKQGFKYRESIITYCHFDDNGRIVTDTGFLDKHFENGVGQYNANWDKIEAEWFYEVSSGITKEGSKETGFKLTNITNDSWVRFAKVNFEQSSKSFEAKLALLDGEGELEIRLNSSKGTLLGKVKLGQVQVSEFQLINCNMKKVKGEKDIYLVFKSKEKSSLKLDWIRFNNPK